jgi:flavin reductase
VNAVGIAMLEVFDHESTTPLEAKQKYHEGMAALAGAVHIVTTRVDDQIVGFAATAVCSVTDEPPTLLVCLNHSASVYGAFSRSDKLCVNTLSARQENVSRLFGGKAAQRERFRAGEWSVLTTGAPVLEDAAVAFDCRVKNRISIGSHDVMICQVECVKRDINPSALVYFSRRYHELV